MAIVNHHAMYFAGMLMLANVRRFDWKKCWQIYLGIGVIVGYSWIIYKFTSFAELYGKPLLIQITDGAILGWFGFENVTALHETLYFVFAIVLLSLIVCGFYFLNYLEVKRRKKKGLPTEYFPKNLKEIYKYKAK